jgi:hypothetical protein
MIRECRDPVWWRALAELVQPDFPDLDPAFVASKVADADIIPLACEHGGFLFVRRDPLGLVFDLHALFTREGKGREVHGALPAALDHIFAMGGQLILVAETSRRQSRPPLSFGFRPTGEATDTAAGAVTLWTLTRPAWLASPAHRRLTCRS